MAVKVYPYKQGSKSARTLSRALRGRVLYLEGSRYRYRRRDTIINWGSSVQDNYFPMINDPYNVRIAANKLDAFVRMSNSNVSIPPFWTNQEDIPDEAFPVVCRTTVTGHSGAGIVIASNRDELVAAPLYTKYIKKRDEYRIHVGSGKVISIQRKAFRHGQPALDTRIRNHANGFVFVRDLVDPPEQVLGQAVLSVLSMGLDFGAVDIGWNQHHNLACVFEVNTAPGLEGQTINDYATYFKEFIL